MEKGNKGIKKNMDIKQFTQQLNEKYKSECKGDSFNENEFIRNSLLLLNSVEDIKLNKNKFIAMLLNYKATSENENYDEDLRNYFLLTYKANGENVIIEKCLEVWLNLDTMEIAPYKPYDAFSEDDNCIMIKNYEVIPNIKWQDLTLPYKWKKGIIR